MHKLKRAFNPDIFALAEKSHGHPTLDRIVSGFREWENAKASAETYRLLCQAMSGEVTGVRVEVTMTVTGGELTREQMLASALDGDPELAHELEKHPELRAQIDQEMDQLLSNGQNRQDRTFQLNAHLDRQTAATILQTLAGHLPNPAAKAGHLAELLRVSSLNIYDPEYEHGA